MVFSIKKAAVFIQKREVFFQIFLIILAALFVGILILVALFSKPIADDFSYFSHPLIHNPVAYTVDFFVNNTGRYAQGMSVALLYDAFKEKAVIAGPIIQITLLVGVATWIAFSFLRLSNAKKNIGQKAITISLLTTSLMLLAAPSLFDSLYWLTSSTVYVFSLIGLLLNLGFALYIYRRPTMRWWHYTLLAVSVFICQSFSEPTSAITIAFSGVLLLVAIIILRKNHSLLKISFTILTASAAGFLAVYLSPGSRQRQGHAESKFDFHAMFIDTIKDLSYLGHIFISWRGLIIIGLGLVLSYFLPKLNKRVMIHCLITGLSLVILPLYITLVISTYSMGTYIPLRIYTVPMALAAIGLVLIVDVVVSWTLERFKEPFVAMIGLPILSVLFVTAGFITALTPTFDILQAEILRSSAYETRATSINRQLGERQQSIYVTPAPLILNDTEAGDLSFADKQVPWLVDGFKRYYSIADKELIISHNVPNGYCLTTQAPTWYGIHTCVDQAKISR